MIILAIYLLVLGSFLFAHHCASVRSGTHLDPYRDVGQGGITKEGVDQQLALLKDCR
jgi:hypothetical protein